MSRTDARSDAREAQVAEVALDALLDAGAEGPLRVVDDLDGHLEAALAEAGIEPLRWCRVARRDRATAPWPVAVKTVAGAALRLPKARSAIDMAVHGIASELPVGGRLWVYGANDEGIRSAGKRLAPLFEHVETIATRRKCRVWQGVRTDVPARAPLAAWRTETALEVPGEAPLSPWIELPGVFAAGRLDEGSAALLAALAPVRPDERVLDFGCGAGALSAVVARRQPAATLHLLDADAVALEAARLNVPGAASYRLGDGWAAAPDLRIDRVISNPPIHRGKGEDFGVLQSLIAEAGRHMGRAGRLELVVQRQVPLERWLRAVFSEVKVVSESGRFRVWSARRPVARARRGR